MGIKNGKKCNENFPKEKVAILLEMCTEIALFVIS